MVICIWLQSVEYRMGIDLWQEKHLNLPPPPPQVTLVHVNAIAKNAADDKLRHSLRRFAHTYPSPATVVLISGDVNFSMELNDLMNVHNLTVVLVHNTVASDALKVFANRLVEYEGFIKDVEPPSQHQVSMGMGMGMVWWSPRIRVPTGNIIVTK